MEKSPNYLPDSTDLKRHLPRGYIKKVAAKIKRANQGLSEEERIACSDFMISKVVNEMKHSHPIFTYVIEVIMEEKKAERDMKNRLKDTFNKITTI